MKFKLTLWAAVGCLMLATSCKKPEETTQYATNKAGERLVEKITFTNSEFNDNDSIYLRFDYNTDGLLKTYTENYEAGYRRIWSYGKRDNILYLNINDAGASSKTSFDLNEKGWIVLDRGWDGNQNYRLTYDANGYLYQVFEEDKLLWTFEWEDDNIVNEETTYLPQSHPSNIDWGAVFGSWNNSGGTLAGIVSINNRWGFLGGFLGNKCKGLPSEDKEANYVYEFDKDGFVSTVYRTMKNSNETDKWQVSYLKK